MKITKVPPKNSITMKTKATVDKNQSFAWWKGKSQKERTEQILATVSFLKESQNYRQKSASVFARLYGNQSLMGFAGTTAAKLDSSTGLPADRPTFNIIQSATDTLVSKITQSRPSPVFLTDNGDYKQRNLAKKLNNFIQGEFYQTKTYEKTAIMLRDACVLGDGVLKVYETPDNKVGVDRVLPNELFVDPTESMYGEPRQLYQVKLVDRAVLADAFPSDKSTVDSAERSYLDNSADSSKTVSDLVLVVEGWHLPSGPDAKDGRHIIACSSGTILDEPYTKPFFPFVFLHYSPRMLGFWAQGVAEQLMGTQMEINSLLWTISKSIKLVGVPRVFVESGSKIVRAHLNNDVGSIVEYQGTKPIYEVAPCVPQELYAQLQRMIDYGYQQCGVSALDASAQKPAGLDSGEAIRSYDDISNDRFAALSKRYDNIFIDLAYLIIDTAKDIAKRDGKYQTVYPNKNGVKQIDLPAADMLENPFVIQCFNMSSLPRDPAGRLAKVTEMIQSGMITLKEGRRLLDFPDIQQMDTLAAASEERIFQILDDIIEEGKYVAPDPYMQLDLAAELCVQYINLYTSAKLEPEKTDMLITFEKQVRALLMPPAPIDPMTGQPLPASPIPVGGQPVTPQPPQAQPEALPTSELLPFSA